MEEKFKIKGKLLFLSEINFQFPEIYSFLKSFLSPDEHFEVHTSGSTGIPKLISIPKKYMRASARKTIGALNLKKDDKALLCLSTDKIGGIMMLVRWLEGELDLYPEGVSSNPLTNTNGGYDFGAMVPLQVQQSIGDLNRVKKLIIGGAPIDPSLERELSNLTNEVYHTYGMTETISHVALKRVNSSSALSFFKALPKVRFSVDGRNCLVINAPEIGIQDLVTNDVVELNSDTEFIWKGRFDNVVNSGGIKLLPEEVEKKVGDIGVPYFLFGEPDTKLGERLVMVTESPSLLALETLAPFFSGLSKYEIPKAVYNISKFVAADGGKLNRQGTIDLLQ